MADAEKAKEAKENEVKSLEKEKAELQEEKAALLRKLKDARRQAIVDFMASDQFSSWGDW